MRMRHRYMGARSNQMLLAAVGLSIGALWVGVAPHVVVRHWRADTNPAIECRQLLNGGTQWTDPQIGRAGWTADNAATRYC